MTPPQERHAVLDGLRGYFLVFMTLHHLGFRDGAWIQRFNHSSLGFVEDAQGFVFLSGLVLGMSYTRALQRTGALWRRAWQRSKEIYLLILQVLLLLTFCAAVLPGAREYWTDYLGELAQSPLHYLTSVLALAYQPALIDILPQYLLYLLAAPVLVRWSVQGYGNRVLLGSVLLWACAQFGLVTPLANWYESFVVHRIPPFGVGGLRSYFNPLAWQLLFVVGLVLGCEAARERPVAGTLFDSSRRWLPALAALAVAGFMLLKLAFDLAWLDLETRAWLASRLRRPDLGPIYVCNFAATGYLVAWLLTQTRGASVVLAAGALLRRLFLLPFLVRLGRHSLHVYAWHVLVAYLLVALQWYWGPFGEWTKTVLALAAIASLWLPAYWRNRRAAA